MTQNSNNLPPTGPPVITNLPPTPTKMGAMIHYPGALKKVLPMAAFFMAFTTVMTLLLMYYDNTGKVLLKNNYVVQKK